MYGKKCPNCNQKVIMVCIRTGMSNIFSFRCKNCCIDFDYKGNVVRKWKKNEV